jgi:hypothetical protein
MADDAPIRELDVPTVERLARQMYAQDQEAWKATDILRAQAPSGQKPHGWIVVTRADGDVVRFIRDGSEGPEVWCDISFSPQPETRCVEPQDHTLVGDELAQYNARGTALANVDQPCSPTYNTIALKDPQRSGWLVWAMAATTTPGAIVYGRHYRFTISADGKSVVQRDALSHSCFTAPPPDPTQGKVVAEFFTQLVSNTPVETTVFLSLSFNTAFVILTPDRKTWMISKGKITELEIPPGK